MQHQCNEQVMYLLQRKRQFCIALSILFVFLLFFHGGLWKSGYLKNTVRTNGTTQWSGISFLLGDLFGFGSNAIHKPLDIHIENSSLGHTGEVTADHDVDKNGTITVAVGLGITSKIPKTARTGSAIEDKVQFLHTFLPTFCQTASSGYRYALYLAYDHTDIVFSDSNFLESFQEASERIFHNKCSHNIRASLHFVQCAHSGKPAWAQNDAMLEAYLDDADFYYRINDDTRLVTPNWTEIFIATLASFDPPNFGVVGPNNTGGNIAILTYDFVHRTHLEVFGFYYPRLFTDWWGDRWVTDVYPVGHRMKVMNVKLTHTMALGQRYNVRWKVKKGLSRQLDQDRAVAIRYMEYLNSARPNASGHNIISMSLFSKDPTFTWGAIRNAQLLPVDFPGWTLRVYILHPASSNEFPDWSVPGRIVRKLRQLGTQIVYVESPNASVPPLYWRYLVLDDPSTEYFLIRDAESRLSRRDYLAVQDWMDRRSKDTALHCIRDHPSHAHQPIVDGLWGGHAPTVRDAVNLTSIYSWIEQFYSGDSENDESETSLSTNRLGATDGNFSVLPNITSGFLHSAFWPLLSSKAFCHDSVSCKSWNNTWPFLTILDKFEGQLGRVYDAYGDVVKSRNSTDFAYPLAGKVDSRCGYRSA